MAVPLSKIIERLNRMGGSSFSLADVQRGLDISARQRRELHDFIAFLVDASLLRQYRRGRYKMRARLETVSGKVRLRRGGGAWLHRDDDDGGGIYIARQHTGAAFDGDEVLALLLPGRRTQRPEAVVVEIIRRGGGSIIGVCRRVGATLVVHERDFGWEFELNDAASGLDNHLVAVAIDRYPEAGVRGSAHLLALLGEVGSAQTDINSTAWRLGLPLEFDAAVVERARQVAQPVSDQERSVRVDLTALPLVTIDGADARDFDDAVALRREVSGSRLWVAIADVSHYVRHDDIVDGAARERGTSVYFPCRCIPMLPEVLSNGICSLKPRQERLVLVAEMLFDRTGRRQTLELYPAVMRSRARLTYAQVQHLLDGGCADDIDAEVAAMLSAMDDLARKLGEQRRQRGAIDFDLPEADIRLSDAGLVHHVGRRWRGSAHRLIEEFMLAANEAVAQWLAERRQLAMFRVHEAPQREALLALQQYVAAFDLGFNLNDDGSVDARQLQRLVADAQLNGHDYAVNRVLLRSMQQARYSAELLPHFGLGSEAYCHFTSPIRRYPDLITHRLIHRLLNGDSRWLHADLATMAQTCSAQERRAAEAERDIIDLRKCQFMADKIGLRYSGRVTGVAEFGFFVELDDFFIEALVPVRTLGDDYYHYDAEHHRLVGQRRRQVYHIGKPVQVVVAAVREKQREIDFIIAGSEIGSVRRGRGRRKNAGRKI